MTDDCRLASWKEFHKNQCLPDLRLLHALHKNCTITLFSLEIDNQVKNSIPIYKLFSSGLYFHTIITNEMLTKYLSKFDLILTYLQKESGWISQVVLYALFDLTSQRSQNWLSCLVNMSVKLHFTWHNLIKYYEHLPTKASWKQPVFQAQIPLL